ncbi:MAG: hypothetical protein ACYDA4_06270 [Ignavibacteriaceae bacterium]
MKKLSRTFVLRGENIGYILIIIIALILSSASSTMYAQVHFSIHFNLGSQPAWGPAGYDYVEYYYLPGIDVYYSVPLHCYYYNDRGRWVRSEYLPPRYRNYDIYNSYKVVLNERDPWRYDRVYRQRYYAYRDRYDQRNIRDSHDVHHNENQQLNDRQRHDNGNHKGWYKNKGNHDKGHEGDHGNHGH